MPSVNIVGENPEEVRPLMARLRASGIGSILAYSVESDVDAVACDTDAAEVCTVQPVHANMHGFQPTCKPGPSLMC